MTSYSIFALSFISLIIAFCTWRITEKRNKDKFLKELFNEFNKRYAELNIYIQNSIIREKFDKCSDEEKDAIADYANLCAEEYYWYKKKYISKEIWISWQNGMKNNYKKNKSFKEYWDKEMKDEKESYYMDKNEIDFISK